MGEIDHRWWTLIDWLILAFGVLRSIKEESQWKIKLRGLMLSSANTKIRSKGLDLVLLKKLSKLVLSEFSSKRRCECLFLLLLSMRHGSYGFTTNSYHFCLGTKDNVTCSIIRLLTLIKFHLLLKASKMLNKLYVPIISFFLIFFLEILMCFFIYESYDSSCTWMNVQMTALKSANKELKGMMKTVKIQDIDVCQTDYLGSSYSSFSCR